MPPGPPTTSPLQSLSAAVAVLAESEPCAQARMLGRLRARVGLREGSSASRENAGPMKWGGGRAGGRKKPLHVSRRLGSGEAQAAEPP